MQGVMLSETEVSPVLWGMSLPMPDADYEKGGDGADPKEISMIHEIIFLVRTEGLNDVRKGKGCC